MATSEMETVLNNLRVHEAQYTPNAEVTNALRERSFVAVIGPMAVGKSSVIEAVCASDVDFKQLESFTTREPRAGDYEFTFLPHNIETIADIDRKRHTGELVQYAVHPSTGYIYGSELAGYNDAYTVQPILSSNVAQFRQLGFKSLTEVALVCHPGEWQKRFEKRAATMPLSDIKKRLSEAQESLRWCLEEPEIAWVKNRHKRVTGAARGVIAIAKNQEEGSDHRFLGLKLYRHINRLANEL